MSSAKKVVIIRDGSKLDGSKVRALVTDDGWAIYKLGVEDCLLIPGEWELYRGLEDSVRTQTRALVRGPERNADAGNRRGTKSKRVLGPPSHG